MSDTDTRTNAEKLVALDASSDAATIQTIQTSVDKLADSLTKAQNLEPAKGTPEHTAWLENISHDELEKWMRDNPGERRGPTPG